MLKAYGEVLTIKLSKKKKNQAAALMSIMVSGVDPTRLAKVEDGAVSPHRRSGFSPVLLVLVQAIVAAQTLVGIHVEIY